MCLGTLANATFFIINRTNFILAVSVWIPPPRSSPVASAPGARIQVQSLNEPVIIATE